MFKQDDVLFVRRNVWSKEYICLHKPVGVRACFMFKASMLVHGIVCILPLRLLHPRVALVISSSRLLYFALAPDDEKRAKKK